jgi:hypothetical protein
MQRLIKKEIVDAIVSEEKIKELEGKIISKEISPNAASNLILKAFKKKFN